MTPIDRDVLRLAFALLDGELRRRGVRGRILLAGGAVMALLYDPERVTRDVDGQLVEGHGALIDASRAVASTLHLPAGWLNEGVTAYLSTEPDSPTPVFDRPHLSVAAVSTEHMIALKARAARTQDLEDLRVLAAAAGVADAAGVLRIVDRFFPHDPISDRARAAVEDLLGVGRRSQW
jgi:predicted nucleotidyltransferase